MLAMAAWRGWQVADCGGVVEGLLTGGVELGWGSMVGQWWGGSCSSTPRGGALKGTTDAGGDAEAPPLVPEGPRGVGRPLLLTQPSMPPLREKGH